jgi:predicted nucleic-acid-binding protein
MHAVDTNVLVRLLVRDDPSQARAAERFVAGGAWVSHLVLAETCWVLASVYDVPRVKLGNALELLLDHEHLVLEDPAVVAAALARFRATPKVGFSDCLILEVARKAGHTPLGTFDRALGAVNGARRLGR